MKKYDEVYCQLLDYTVMPVWRAVGLDPIPLMVGILTNVYIFHITF